MSGKLIPTPRKYQFSMCKLIQKYAKFANFTGLYFLHFDYDILQFFSMLPYFRMPFSTVATIFTLKNFLEFFPLCKLVPTCFLYSVDKLGEINFLKCLG